MFLATSLQAFIKAVSWTFLHSIWIGLIAAFLAGITILATKKRSSSLRYNILSTILFLFIGCTVLVSINEFVSVFSGENAGYNIFAAQADDPSKELLAGPTETSTIFSNAISFFNKNASYLLIIWFLIFIFKLMQLIYGISRLERLRNERLVAAPADWMHRLEIFKNQLNIRKPVQLFESHLVKIPVTLGYLRPIILFPIGTLTGIPPAQLDAVLLHELAHIRRNDYLVNIVQLVLESIFFFNPCVLWISSLIRKERENCCDDMAIRKMDSKMDFLRALLSFQDLAFGERRVVQALTASKTLLVDRAHRIVYAHNSKLSKSEKKSLFFAIGFLAILVFISKTNYTESGISGLIGRFQTNAIGGGNDWIQQSSGINLKKDKNTLAPMTVKDNKSSVHLSQEPTTKDGKDIQQAFHPKDTGIVINIVPVITRVTVVKMGDSLLSSDPRPRTYLSRSNTTIASIIEDLKKENLIRDEGEKYSFLLSNEKLLVNGIVQPENIHQKIFSKYVPDPALEHINLYYECCR